MKILIIGDSHIPSRTTKIPDEICSKIKELTKLELFNYTFFTGDLIKYPELIEFLNSKTAKDVFIVVGNMDYFEGNRNLPVYQELNLPLGKVYLKIGLIHGAQIEPRGDRMQLEDLAIEKGDQILISGHTHKEDVFLTEKGILLLNPGSSTGAWSFIASGVPSFIVLFVEDKSKEISASLFQLDRNFHNIKESKFRFKLKNNKVQSF